MAVVFANRANARFLNMFGRIEIGFADLHMHHTLALRFERSGACENFEGAFGSEPRHGFGETIGFRCEHLYSANLSLRGQ